MEAKESLQRRYLQALAAMMDEDAPDRRWIPVVSFGSASETVVDAAYKAAHRVDRDVIILELFADDREVVQHRIRAAYRAGKVRQYVSDGMLWIPNAAGRAVIVLRTGSSRFRIAVDAKGGLRRHVGLPTADLTFGAALAAKRLREIAGSTMPDALMPALQVEGR